MLIFCLLTVKMGGRIILVVDLLYRYLFALSMYETGNRVGMYNVYLGSVSKSKLRILRIYKYR